MHACCRFWPLPNDSPMNRLEIGRRRAILAAPEHTRDNRTRAGAHLGIGRAQVHARVKRYGLAANSIVQFWALRSGLGDRLRTTTRPLSPASQIPTHGPVLSGGYASLPFGISSALYSSCNDLRGGRAKAMSQAAVERALGKLITDECFRSRFFKDPAAASFSAGLELSQAELDALSRLPVKSIARFSGCLDDRILRVPLDDEGRPLCEEASRARRVGAVTGAGSIPGPAQGTKEDHR